MSLKPKPPLQPWAQICVESLNSAEEVVLAAEAFLAPIVLPLVFVWLCWALWRSEKRFM